MKYKLRKGSDKVTLSSELFTVVFEEVFKNLEWEEAGIQINGEYLNNLKFADDSSNEWNDRWTTADDFAVVQKKPESGFKGEYEEN